MQRVEIELGDTVEISFKLKYKKAEVARRPDKALYHQVWVSVECATEAKYTDCFSREVTTDDQPIKGEWLFGPSEWIKTPGFFKEGELWKVNAYYRNAEGTEQTPVTHIGDVKIKSQMDKV